MYVRTRPRQEAVKHPGHACAKTWKFFSICYKSLKLKNYAITLPKFVRVSQWSGPDTISLKSRREMKPIVQEAMSSFFKTNLGNIQAFKFCSI